MLDTMYVVKRNGTKEPVAFEKVQERLTKAAEGLAVNAVKVAQGVLTRLMDGITTSDLDSIAANLAFAWSTSNPDYGVLASRIAISSHQKNTPKTMLEAVECLNSVLDRSGKPASLLDPIFVECVRQNAAAIEERINYSRDFLLDYFGFKTLERAYLLRDTNRCVVERPQHLWMRVALGIWPHDLTKAFEMYDMMSLKKYTHATPTLFNAGTKRPQLSSCFLLAIKDGGDSIHGIYDTLKDCALISQYGGGIGLHVSNIRARGSLIRGTGGTSNGIVPMLRVFNNTARYVDQCFTPETLIETSIGRKPIATIQQGEEVMTSCGEYRRVNKLVEHDWSGPMIRVNVDGLGESVQVTEEHPVLAIQNTDGSSTEILTLKYHEGLVPLDFIEIGKLRVGDLIAYPAVKDAYSDCKGLKLYRITNMEPVEYTGKVYDFEIDEPHDYLVCGLGIAHNGGGKRNGSFAIYLEPWHADVEDFLDMKKNIGAEEERARDLFYGLWIPDLFMERVDSGGDWTLFCPNEAPGLADVVGAEFKALYERYEAEGRGRRTIKAQDLWFRILDSQIETGTPYLLYKDAANLKSNQQNLGVIKSSNLCVAPETLVLTDKGQFPICELVGQTVNVWNGDKWSEVSPLKTGELQELVKIEFSNGCDIHCTPYHKFIISESYNDKKLIAESVRIDAKDLKIGMKLKKCKFPVVKGTIECDFKYAYTHGFFCGDGRYQPNGIPTCSLYGEKKELLKYLEIKSTSGVPDSYGRINTVLPNDIERKYNVPINASLDCRLKWLAGLCDADGTIAKNGTNESIQIASINKAFLEKVNIMLIGMGINAKVTKSHDVCERELPNGKGGFAIFQCKELWRLLISSYGLKQLSDLGFSTKRLKYEIRKPQRNAEQFVKVVSVKSLGRIDDTYCFNEPLNHAGVFNGILTGNCTEIIEYSSPEETAVCNLASLSLPAFVKDGAFDFKEFRKVVYTATINLNHVIDVNYYPIPEAKTSNMRHRPIGLGVQGLADVFAMLGLAWEDDAAADLNRRIFAHMYYAACEASCYLAGKEGPYETWQGSPAQKGNLQFSLWGVEPLQDPELDWDGLINSIRRIGMRNSLLVAPMPTASTSQILGNCECIEPYATHIFTRRTLAGEFIVVNKHLVKALQKVGIWSEELKDRIIANNGSVQGLSEVPEDIQRVFKTVWEIKQKTLIDMAADRGPYVCQSQSLNLFLADADYRKLSSMHFYAWRKGLKTGIYYLRTRAASAAQKFTVDPTLQQKIAKPVVEECVMCSS